MAKKDAALSSAVSVLVDVLPARGDAGNAIYLSIAGNYPDIEVAPALVSATLLDNGKDADIVSAAADVVVALAAVLKKG